MAIIKKLGTITRRLLPNQGAFPYKRREPLVALLAAYDHDPDKVAIALETERGEPWGVLSTNTYHQLEPGEFVVSWHNHETADLEDILASKLFVDTGKRVDFGHVKGAPVWRLFRQEDMDAFRATLAGESKTPTGYAVNCPMDGLVYLTDAEYSRQMSRPDSSWSCPRCGRPADWDDATYELYISGLEDEAPE